MNKHEYWEGQETKPFLAEIAKDGMVISPEQIVAKYKKDEPIQLPAGFEWHSVDMKNPEELNKVFELLKMNFVEDSKALLRF
jgi:hypothetical protein